MIVCGLLGGRRHITHLGVYASHCSLTSSSLSADNLYSNPILGGSKALGLFSESVKQTLIYCHTNKGCYYPHVKVNVQQRQPSNKDTATKIPHKPAVAMLYSQQTQALSLSPEVLLKLLMAASQNE